MSTLPAATRPPLAASPACLTPAPCPPTSRRAALPGMRACVSGRHPTIPTASEGRARWPQRAPWASSSSSRGQWGRCRRPGPRPAVRAAARGHAAAGGAGTQGCLAPGSAAAAASAKPADAAPRAGAQISSSRSSAISRSRHSSSCGSSSGPAPWHAAALAAQAGEPAQACVPAQQDGAGVQPLAGRAGRCGEGRDACRRRLVLPA